MSRSDPIVIVAAARTALRRFQGELAGIAAHALGAHVIRAALERARFSPQQVDEVFMGCVLPGGLGQVPARQAARGAGLPDAVAATTINKVCASAMKATMIGHDLILAGSAGIVVSGGMESMSASASAKADGAAALILTRRSIAEREKLPILAEIKAHAAHSQEPAWYTMEAL